MSATDALRVARSAGIDLSIDEDDLVLEAASEPPPAVLDMLRQHKAGIIKLLRPELRLNGDSLSAKDWQLFFNERVEIAECHSGLSRAEAEARAFAWCLAEWHGYDGSLNPLGVCRNAAGGLGLIQSDQPTINSVSSVTESESVGAQEPRPSADPARPNVNDTVDADTVGSVDDPEDRAALIEEGADVPRSWAEGYAALCAMPPPTGFSLGRWQSVVDATGVFLDRWADTAIAAGWTDLDVFGCDPDRPAARFDCMGLVLLLDRREVVAVDEDGADLVTNGGATQRFRRRSLPPSTITLWELTR